MTKTVKGILIPRLIVLLAIFLVPLSIFFIFSLVDFNLWYSNDASLNFFVIKILSPIVYSVSWLFFLILFANRFANTMESFDDKISVVPSRLKFFYGLNAIYILFIFVFPIITPVISILSFASFAWRLTTFRKESWEEDTKTSFLTKLVMVLASLIPIFCTVSIIPEFLELPIFLWNNIWLNIIDYLFKISYSLFTALSIGSLIILCSNSGISEYEQLFTDTTQKKSFTNVKVLVVFLFGFFFYLDYYNYPIIDLIYTAGLVIVILTYLINLIRGRSKYGSFKSYFLGYLIAAVFIGSNVILTTDEISGFLRFSSLLISAILYIFVLFYTFITLDE
ncbi:MAG TPA: hypothetical protein VMV43_00845 [Candidatus Nanopelagicaceae bacterium]|nr:hypothetical protein [Candidatus Nanopelagicaceae bacterium]